MRKFPRMELMPYPASLALMQSKTTNPRINPSNAHHKDVMTVLVAFFFNMDEKNDFVLFMAFYLIAFTRSLFAPDIYKPRRSLLTSSGENSPTISPSYMTRIRSDNAKT